METTRLVNEIVRDIMKAFKKGQVPAAAAVYHDYGDVKALKEGIKSGLKDAGMPSMFIERIVR